VSLDIVLIRLKLILKLFRNRALEAYFNLHKKPKKVLVQNMLVIIIVQLNTFYICAFVCLVTQASVLKKAFEMCIIETDQSLENSVSHVMQSSIRFPNRRLERSKTNISCHICIIQSVITVELSKRKFYMKWQTVWAYFCCDKCKLRSTVANVVTYH